jgi:hypothetical protein
MVIVRRLTMVGFYIEAIYSSCEMRGHSMVYLSGENLRGPSNSYANIESRNNAVLSGLNAGEILSNVIAYG